MNNLFIYLNLLDVNAARSIKARLSFQFHPPTTNEYNSFLEPPRLWVGLLPIRYCSQRVKFDPSIQWPLLSYLQ